MMFNVKSEDLLMQLKNMHDNDQKTIAELQKKLDEYNKDKEIQLLKEEIKNIRKNSLIVLGSSEKEKIVNCSYQAEDTGYKVTDEYKITYKKDNVIYVKSIYSFNSIIYFILQRVGGSNSCIRLLIRPNGLANRPLHQLG